MTPRTKTFLRSLAPLAGLTPTMAVTIFTVADTLQYWQAWLFLGLFTECYVMMIANTMAVNPAVLDRREGLGPGSERAWSQRVSKVVGALVFFGTLAVSSYDATVNGPLSLPWIVAGGLLIVFAFTLIAWVFEHNEFAGDAVRTWEGHRVVATGPYEHVRHPMYSAAIVLFVGIPLVLGSLRGLCVSLWLVPLVLMRINTEERLLITKLRGYVDYYVRTPRGLVPRFFKG